MPLPRPMPSVAPRAFYLTAGIEGVVVFHAFAKKTRPTPPGDPVGTAAIKGDDK